MLDNQCDICGRFMKRVWFLATDEPDSWEDSYRCQKSCMEIWRQQWEEVAQ